MSAHHATPSVSEAIRSAAARWRTDHVQGLRASGAAGAHADRRDRRARTRAAAEDRARKDSET